jgi:hypothetical protein
MTVFKEILIAFVINVYKPFLVNTPASKLCSKETHKKKKKAP